MPRLVMPAAEQASPFIVSSCVWFDKLTNLIKVPEQTKCVEGRSIQSIFLLNMEMSASDIL